MRLAIFLLFCVGLAAAVPLHSSDLDDLDEFMLQSEGGGRIGERLKEHFENIINRIKKAFEDGKGVRGDLWKKAQDIYEKLKNLGVELSDKIKTTFEDLRNKMGKNAPTSSNADISNIFDMFKRLKELIKEKLDSEELKAKVEKIFGKGSELAEQIINMLKGKGEKGKNKILDWIDRIIPDKEERSFDDEYFKLKYFFKYLGIDLKERFTKFGEWIKERYVKGMERGKNGAENIKTIAKEVSYFPVSGLKTGQNS
ncbi:hypothetical protein AVEN_64385-1 [Araneus ventricosus]|uniref:Uncharacterized protein n=2 Tax=Araneus ventricosus TaxID=182803 RepID=A0A4Y2T1S8_ARAVE|nr:hypothetical protein AVEN_64385-1 [Araneus ventricosus]